MRTIFSIVNQKGGVGKTTTAVNLATALCATGKTCLIIDLDPQGNASTGLGVPVNNRKPGAYEVLSEKIAMADTVKSTDVNGLGLVPSMVNLSDVESVIKSADNKDFILKSAIEQLPSEYSAIIIDCPPGLNFLTINALAASNKVLIPLQCEFYALEGLTQLMETVNQIKNNYNNLLTLQGIVLTMYDKRNKISELVACDVKNFFKEKVYKTIIPRNVKISEAPSHGMPILMYDISCSGSQAYASLAAEIINQENNLNG